MNLFENQTRSQTRLNLETPFPGLSYYEEKDSSFFFGREIEKDELFRRIVGREKLTVLFGQSGLGKTSLIQAGLFPLLRNTHCLPIPLRLSFGDDAPGLEQQVSLALANALTQAEAEGETLYPGETLWEYFHRVHIWSARNRLLLPVLVIDQFEEVFTLGAQDRRTGLWLQSLGDLIENRIPQSVQLRIEKGGEAPDYDIESLELRVLLALREDFLPDLEDLRPLIPSLSMNRMRLAMLDGERALEAVQRPAPELLNAVVAEEIVRFVAGDKGQESNTPDLKQLQVEPSLLNLVCQQLNRRRIEENSSGITAALLRGSKDRLLTDFYRQCIRDVPDGVAVFVEEQLLTPSGFRRAEALENALNMSGVVQAALMHLVDCRLLRREERFGIPHLELIHDVLTKTVRESRDKRRAEAEKEAERKRQAELRAKLRRSFRQKLLLGTICVVLLGSIAFYYFGWVKSHYSYAKNFIKKYGQLYPVDTFSLLYDAIPFLSDVEHRGMTSRFTSEGWFGKVLTVETIDSNRQPVEGYIRTYLADAFDEDESNLSKKVSRVEFVYDAEGRVVREIARNRFDKMVWGFVYAPLDEQAKAAPVLVVKGMFLGPDGYPQPQRKSPAEFVEITYNEQGYEIKHKYTDRDGNPAPGPDNAYGRSMEYDKEGRLIKLTSMDKDGHPMNDAFYNASVKTIYDKDGNVIEQRAFDADNEPTLVKLGVYKVRSEYDKWGQETNKRFFGLNNEPVVNNRIGIHRIDYEYDSHGNVKSEKLYGTKDEPIKAEEGYWDVEAHERRTYYDWQNHPTEVAYFDEDGNKLTGPEGMHKTVIEYDKHGFFMAIGFFNGEGKAVNLKSFGYHRSEQKNDEYGRAIETRFFDTKKNPVARSDSGYHLIMTTYDRFGNPVEERYFDENNNPVAEKSSGAYLKVQRFDRFKNPLSIEYFNAQRQPIDNKQHFHKLKLTYNDYGLETHRRWYDKDGYKCNGPDGYHHKVTAYDNRGLKRSEENYDVNDQAGTDKNGIHKALWEYNDKGQYIKYQVFGPGNKPVDDDNGDHLVIREFDKRGRETSVINLRADGSPNLDRKLGIAMQTQTWDKENHFTEQAYFNEHGKLVIGPRGYARVVFRYQPDGNVTATYYGADGKPRLNPQLQ